jgi:hypothetical protein
MYVKYSYQDSNWIGPKIDIPYENGLTIGEFSDDVFIKFISPNEEGKYVVYSTYLCSAGIIHGPLRTYKECFEQIMGLIHIRLKSNVEDKCLACEMILHLHKIIQYFD